MSEPYMPFYPGDYLGDTMHLTLEQHGAYVKLMLCMWRTGGWLEDDPKKICQILSITKGRWAKLKPSIERFFIYQDGKFSQQRLLKEREKAREKSAKNSSSGKLGAEAKRRKYKETDLANAKDSPKRNAGIARALPEPEPEPEKNVVVDDARAKPVGLYMQIQEAIGAVVPLSMQRVDVWLANGATHEIILATIRRLMAKRSNDPPSSLNYFEKAIATAIAESKKPMAEPDRQRGNHNARPSRHTGLGEIDYSEGLDGFVTTSPAKRT